MLDMTCSTNVNYFIQSVITHIKDLNSGEPRQDKGVEHHDMCRRNRWPQAGPLHELFGMSPCATPGISSYSDRACILVRTGRNVRILAVVLGPLFCLPSCGTPAM